LGVDFVDANELDLYSGFHVTNGGGTIAKPQPVWYIQGKCQLAGD
jgi:hypothetical protein